MSDFLYRGPQPVDSSLIQGLPAELRALLQQENGFIAFRGGLHVRGACQEPAWHALVTVREGPLALPSLYAAVRPEDVPFGQDCVGDQFLLRDRVVHRLLSETGDLESLDLDLDGFLREAWAAPEEFLSLAPLRRFESDGGQLVAGRLLHAYPPFCATESDNGNVSLRDVDALELLAFHADLARQIRDVPDGGRFRFVLKDETPSE